MTRMRIYIVIVSVLVTLQAGCGSSPTASFYTLSANGTPEADATAQPTARYRVAVGPVTLPEMVNRPQFVVRAGANQVTIAEMHRWAGPLKSEIPRVIAQNLAQLLGTRQVSAYPQSATDDADYRVYVDIQRFDSALGEWVTIDALWAIRSASGEPSAGRSLVQEPAGGGGYDELVAAHNRALARVSRDIAEAIRSADLAQPRQEGGK